MDCKRSGGGSEGGPKAGSVSITGIMNGDAGAEFVRVGEGKGFGGRGEGGGD
jgi:hypothetical protein